MVWDHCNANHQLDPNVQVERNCITTYLCQRRLITVPASEVPRGPVCDNCNPRSTLPGPRTLNLGFQSVICQFVFTAALLCVAVLQQGLGSIPFSVAINIGIWGDEKLRMQSQFNQYWNIRLWNIGIVQVLSGIVGHSWDCRPGQYLSVTVAAQMLAILSLTTCINSPHISNIYKYALNVLEQEGGRTKLNSVSKSLGETLVRN